MSKHLKARKTFIFLSYLVIYALFLISAFIDFKSKYMWEDEGFTFHIIHYNFLKIMGLTAQDVHPFFYYFIAKLFTMPFSNLFTQIKALRFVSILPYFILLLVSNISIRKKFSNTTSLLFMFCIITMPELINNMYQIRMYGWALLFTTLMFLKLSYVYKNLDKNSVNSFLIITLYALLASYTHYYALVTVAIVYISFLILFLISKKHIKYLIVSIVTSTILYLPWLSVLLHQTKFVSRGGIWGTPPNINYLISLIDNLIIANTNSKIYQFLVHKAVFIAAIIIIFSIFIYLIKKVANKINKDLPIIAIGIILPIIVIVIGFIISKIVNEDVLVARYMSTSIGIFWLVISILFGMYVKSKNINVFIKIGLILILMIIGLKSYHFNISNIKYINNQFNTSLMTFKKMPKNANVIYNYPPIACSAASYLPHNYELNHTYGENSIKIWYKVYSNLFVTSHIKPNLSKPTYFVKANNTLNKKASKLTNQFIQENKIHMKQIGIAYFSSDGGKCTVYKINK